MRTAKLLQVFAIYTGLGSALGVALLLAAGAVSGDLASTGGKSLTGFDARVLGIVWLAGLIPAGMAACVMTLLIAGASSMQRSDALRSVVGALVGLLCAALFFSYVTQLGQPGPERLRLLLACGLLGAAPLALMAYMWPRTRAELPSNNSLERSRER